MSSDSYKVEYAKTGRSSCKDSKCKGNIPAGELRIGRSAPSPFGDGEMLKWYHAACLFETLKRARTAKAPDTADGFDGYDSLKKADQEALEEAVKDGAWPGGKKAAKGTKRKAETKKKATKKKKKADSDEEEEASEEDEKPKKKKAAPKKKKATKKAKGSDDEGSGSEAEEKKKPAKKKAASSGGDGDVTYLEKDTKFWKCTISGSEVSAQWGKIGADGQSNNKVYDDEEKARKEYDKIVAKKKKGGYEDASE